MSRDLSSDLPPYLTLQEVSRYFNVHARTVRRWIDAGRLAAIRTSIRRGHIRIPMQALRRLEQQLVA